MKPFKIAVARFPGSGSERMETVGWLIRTIREMDMDPRIESVQSIVVSDTPITMGRNRAVLEARATGCQYLLMVDSDMQPDTPYRGCKPFWATSWDFMMERRGKKDTMVYEHYGHSWEGDVPPLPELPPATIAAPYCGPSPDQCCYVFEWKSRGSGHPNPDFQLGMVSREYAAIKAGIQEAAALPTGLILYDMRVFDTLPPPWFEYEYGDPPFNSVKATTEDVYQTRNASLLGLPQYCNWDAWATHIKTEKVGKPIIVTRTEVHASLRDAVLRGVDAGDRLICLDEPAKFQESVPSLETDEDILEWLEEKRNRGDE